MKAKVTGFLKVLALAAMLVAMPIMGCNATQSPTASPDGPTSAIAIEPEDTISSAISPVPETQTETPGSSPERPAAREQDSQEAPHTALQEIAPSNGDVSTRDAPPVANSNNTMKTPFSPPSDETEVITVEEMLTLGLYAAGASPVHIVFRGIPVNNSVRCAWRGTARTTPQREQAIRYWLGLSDQDDLPDPEYLEALFKIALDTLDVNYLETAKSNLMAVAKGGLATEYQFLTCFADYSTSSYLLGGGPQTVTVAFDRMDEEASYELYVRERDAGQYGDDPLRSESDHTALMQEKATRAEAALREQIGSQEAVVFLAPMGNHNAITFEAWLSVAQWNVVANNQGVDMVERRGAPTRDPEYSQTVANLTSRITATAMTDSFSDSRIANVSGLNQYYRDIGAYDDITPGDGSDETFMPAMPPPVPTCAGSAAVGTNPDQGLIDDCNALLDMKNTLAGTAALNWSKDLDMTSWDGIRLGGTPRRVQFILLTSKDLDGSIPALLGNLTELSRIDLDENSLTGAIPPQLGMLKKLTHLYLQDNELSGEIPPELGSMTALQVLYPENNELTGAVPEEIGSLSNLTQLVLADNQLSGPLPGSLGNLSNLGHLRLRDNDFTGQIPRTLSALNIRYLGLSGNDFTGCLPTGLETGGNDDLWRPELAALPSCGPTFGETGYSFTLSATESAGTAVGSVTAASYETGDTVVYSIVAGNEDGLFAVDSGTGAITLARAATAEDDGSYSLTVEAEDGYGQKTSVTVTVSLTG